MGRPDRTLRRCHRSAGGSSSGWNFCTRSANPSGLVYGVVAVGTLVAAEGAHRETYPDVVAASALALILYWLAHAYARYFADRLEKDETSVVARLAGARPPGRHAQGVGAAHRRRVVHLAPAARWRPGSRSGCGWPAARSSPWWAPASPAGAAAEVLRDVVGTVLGAGILGVRVLLQ